MGHCTLDIRRSASWGRSFAFMYSTDRSLAVDCDRFDRWPLFAFESCVFVFIISGCCKNDCIELFAVYLLNAEILSIQLFEIIANGDSALIA
jgi:hypothetical protein